MERDFIEHSWLHYTDKNEKKIFLIEKEIQMELLRNGFLIYEEMRKYITIFEEVAVSHI
jgi:hypothetical protein